MNKNNNNYESLLIEKPVIVSFRPSQAKPIAQEVIDSIKQATNVDYYVTTSWGEMADLMKKKPSLITFHTSLVAYDQVSITEFVSMLQTLIRCVPECKDTHIAAVIYKDITFHTIKILQKTDVLGIIPSASTFGIENHIKSVTALINGIPYWPKDIISDLSGNEPKRIKPNAFKLTARQQQVLELICNRGLTNKRIASALKITESTVKIHVSSILKTYGVRNRTQLAVAANSLSKD